MHLLGTHKPFSDFSPQKLRSELKSFGLNPEDWILIPNSWNQSQNSKRHFTITKKDDSTLCLEGLACFKGKKPKWEEIRVKEDLTAA